MSRHELENPLPEIDYMEDVVSTDRDIETSDPAEAARHLDAGPGQQIAREMARRWLAQAQIDGAAEPGRAFREQAEITQLKAQIKRLREDNEILTAATVLCAGALDPRNN